MEIYVSLSQDSTYKNRARVSSPESTTGRTDLADYASLEKKLRLTEEAKDKEKLAQKAGGGDSVKGKKGAKKSGGTKPEEDDTDIDTDTDTDGGDDETDDASDDTGDDSDGKSKTKKGGKKSDTSGDADAEDAEDPDADESEGDDGDADAESIDDEDLE